jgi:hypothetical protein
VVKVSLCNTCVVLSLSNLGSVVSKSCLALSLSGSVLSVMISLLLTNGRVKSPDKVNYLINSALKLDLQLDCLRQCLAERGAFDSLHRSE